MSAHASESGPVEKTCKALTARHCLYFCLRCTWPKMTPKFQTKMAYFLSFQRLLCDTFFCGWSHAYQILCDQVLNIFYGDENLIFVQWEGILE